VTFLKVRGFRFGISEQASSLSRERRRSSSGDAVADGEKKFVCAGGRAEAEQPAGAVGRVAKGVGRIGRDVDRLASLRDQPLAAKRELDLPFQDAEQLLEVMPVGWWPAARWDVHVD
jgi:hypothetical protein